MSRRQYSPLLALLIIVLLSGSLLTGCVPGGGSFNPKGWAGPVVADDAAFVCSLKAGRLVSLDLSDRKTLWQFVPKSEAVSGGFGCSGAPTADLVCYASPVVSGTMLYVAAYDGKVYGINTANAREEYGILLAYESNKEKPNRHKVVITDADRKLGDLVDYGVITKEQRKQIEDRTDVEEKLGKDTRWVDDVVDLKIIGEERGADIKRLIEIESVVWTYDTKGHIVGDPVISGDMLIVAAGKRLFALDAQKGLRLWDDVFAADGNIWCSPSVWDGIAYFGDQSHKLYAVDLETGESAWDEPRDFDGPVLSEPLIVEGTIYIGTFESKFYAIDAATGEDVWQEPFKGDDWFWNGAVYRDGVAFVGSLGGTVYAIDAQTGELIWEYQTPIVDRIRAAPVIVNDMLVVGAQDDHVHTLNLETGKPVWSPLYLDGDILANPWADGNTVYFITQDDILHAVDVADSGQELWSTSVDRD